jgi:hypothetical protein
MASTGSKIGRHKHTVLSELHAKTPGTIISADYNYALAA